MKECDGKTREGDGHLPINTFNSIKGTITIKDPK